MKRLDYMLLIGTEKGSSVTKLNIGQLRYKAERIKFLQIDKAVLGYFKKPGTKKVPDYLLKLF